MNLFESKASSALLITEWAQPGDKGKNRVKKKRVKTELDKTMRDSKATLHMNHLASQSEDRKKERV